MSDEGFLFTSESVTEGHPGQGGRPDLRRDRGRRAGCGSAIGRGRRDAADHRAGGAGRRDHHHRRPRFRRDCPPGNLRDRNIVAAGLADRAEVQVAYAIGVARPLSLLIETFGTEKVDAKTLTALVRDHFDLRPAALVQALDLRRPIYRPTAAYGHFGRDEPGFTWERTNAAAALRAGAGLA